MKNLIIVNMVMFMSLLTGCGGSGGGSSGNEAGGAGGGSQKTDPNTPVLNTIGYKTIILGDPPLAFTVSASDPNNLTLMYSTDGSVGTGANPYIDTGSVATFNPDTQQFSWDVTGVAPADYWVQFTVMNTNGYSDSETIRIRVQDQPSEFEIGQRNYDADCARCHGPEGRNGSQTLLQCVDPTLFYEKINGGSMTGYANGWSSSDQDAVLFYLHNVNPSIC